MGNFILGIVAGLVLFLIGGYVIYRLDENNISKQIGEEYEYIIMTKSEMEKYEKYKKEEIEKEDAKLKTIK